MNNQGETAFYTTGIVVERMLYGADEEMFDGRRFRGAHT